jgi:dCMP deaminase
MPSQKPSTNSPKTPKSTNTALIAYVPALHAGYKRLFDKYAGADIYVLDRSIIEHFDHLRKDIRSLQPEEAVAAIAGWGHSVQTVAWGDVPATLADYANIVAPNDEIAEKLQRQLKNAYLQLEEVFLRWDRRALEAAQDALDPERAVSHKAADQKIMQQVAAEAAKSTNIWRRVAAAVVKNGKVMSIMSNQHQPLAHSNWTDGDPRNNANRGTSIDISTDMHAEARLIADAAKHGTALQGCDIYVTTFPCPTCAKLIANAGFKHCYYAVGYAMLDGKEVLDANDVELIQIEGVALDDTNPDVWVKYPEKAKQ